MRASKWNPVGSSHFIPALIMVSVFPIGAAAVPITMEFSFPGGFPLQLNGGANSPSGPLTFTVRTDNTTPDLDASTSRGRFALTSIHLTAPSLGFTREPIVSPTLFVDTFSSGMTIDDEFIDTDIGWNGGPAPATFMDDINDLSTLPLPTHISPTNSTFFLRSITMASGDTLEGDVGGGGPGGHFWTFVPEPTSFVLVALTLSAIVIPRPS